jgi:hypothetical protein
MYKIIPLESSQKKLLRRNHSKNRRIRQNELILISALIPVWYKLSSQAQTITRTITIETDKVSFLSHEGS